MLLVLVKSAQRENGVSLTLAVKLDWLLLTNKGASPNVILSLRHSAFVLCFEVLLAILFAD